MATVPEVEAVINRHMDGNRRLSVTTLHAAAKELVALFSKPGGRIRWGVYTPGPVHEPVKIGFGSKAAAQDWWLAEHGLSKADIESRGIKTGGYLQIDLTGSTAPVLIREEIKTTD